MEKIGLANCLRLIIISVLLFKYFSKSTPPTYFFPVEYTTNSHIQPLNQEYNYNSTLYNYKASNIDVLNETYKFTFEHWVFINELLSPNDYIFFIKNSTFLNKLFVFPLEFINYKYFNSLQNNSLLLPEISSLKDHITLDTNNSSLTDKNFFLNFVDFYNYQFALLKLIESFFIKKIAYFLFFNLFFFLIIIFSLFLVCQSTNLIYTLISFLVFAVSTGLFSILWGAEYIGLCIILIYGAAIPVLALYIIMLVNVDLIQRLFFIESIKVFSYRNFFFFTFISLIFSFLTILFFSKGIPFSYTTFNSYEYWFHLEMSSFIKWFVLTNSVSYGITNSFDLTTLYNLSDIDKVASAAFKVSTNELLALVLLLLIAIIVVLSISRTFSDSNIILEKKNLNFQNFEINQIDLPILLGINLRRLFILFDAWLELLSGLDSRALNLTFLL